LNTAIEYNENELSYALLGEIYIENSEHKSALAAARKAVDLDSKEENYHLLSRALMGEKKYEEANDYINLCHLESGIDLEAKAICLAEIGDANGAELIAKGMLSNLSEYDAWAPTSLFVYFITNNFIEIENNFTEITKYYETDNDLLSIYLWALLNLKRMDYAHEYVKQLIATTKFRFKDKGYIKSRIKSIDRISKEILRNSKKPEIIYGTTPYEINFYFE